MLKLSERYPTKRALITGAGSGIGEALSLQLAADQWHIALCDVNGTNMEEAAARVEAAGGQSHPYAFDVRDRDAYSRAVEDFAGRTGGLDLLINNAGIGSGGAVGSMSLEDWDTTLSINLMGVVNGLHFCVPVLKAQQSGHIINTASAAAWAAMPNMAAYNASKAAVLAISETLYTELLPYNVGVSCLMPTYIRTGLDRTLIGTPEMKKTAVKLITKSGYTPEEVAAYTLERAGLGSLYIVFPGEVRKVWKMKRLLPRRYFRSILKYAEPPPPKDTP